MKNIPSYAKVLTLGSTYTENALIGEVIIQEKVDGSMLRMGENEDSELVISSKSQLLHCGKFLVNPYGMFSKGVEYILSIEEKVMKFPKDSYFYCEFLQKPKHNVLNYKWVPKNNIVLFDAIIGSKYQNREELQLIANEFDIDLIPELFRGTLKDRAVGGGYSNPVDHLKRIIETTPSFLGNELIEGVVIKNYGQTILLGGHVFPLFTKYVRETYKERHEVEWNIKKPKNSLEDYIKGFKNENRWQKAVLHLKEKGLLKNAPQDISALIKEVQEDIEMEEKENIKDFLYNKFRGDILRTSIKGVAEWYKEKLLENLK